MNGGRERAKDRGERRRGERGESEKERVREKRRNTREEYVIGNKKLLKKATNGRKSRTPRKRERERAHKVVPTELDRAWR